LAKSKLSTAAMKRLQAADISLQMIADLAGITPNGVRNRLRAKTNGKGNAYMSRTVGAMRAYCAQQRERQEDYQRESLKHAAEFGRWKPSEIRYLEKNAAQLTQLEIAIALKRTYFSVRHYTYRHGIETRE